MLAPTKRVFMLVRPEVENKPVYATLAAAQRACAATGGHVEEWHAYEGSDRIQLRCVWTRKGSMFEPRWIQRGG